MHLTQEEQEIVDHLDHHWRTQIAAEVEPLRRDLQTLKARTSRPPGSSSVADPAAAGAAPTLSHQLLADTGYLAFAKGVLTRGSSFGTELRLPASRKAATPVSGISPTEYLPQRIWGPP